MRKRIQQARNNEDGFSLIELLLVIAILGILSGIVVFGVSTFRDQASDQACNTEKRTVQAAIDAAVARRKAA